MGASTGIVVRPYFNWIRVGVSGGYNGAAPGIIGSLTLDPIPFPVGITATVDAGHYWDGKLVGVSKSPTYNYDFITFQPGLEFGSRNSWRLYFRGGVSWLYYNVSDINSVANLKDNSIKLGDINGNAMIPSFKIGLSVYF